MGLEIGVFIWLWFFILQVTGIKSKKFWYMKTFSYGNINGFKIWLYFRIPKAQLFCASNYRPNEFVVTSSMCRNSMHEKAYHEWLGWEFTSRILVSFATEREFLIFILWTTEKSFLFSGYLQKEPNIISIVLPFVCHWFFHFTVYLKNPSPAS